MQQMLPCRNFKILRNKDNMQINKTDAKAVFVKSNKIALKQGFGGGKSENALMKNELVLVRGLPGSGKSSFADSLTLIGYKKFEADMFFEIDGEYVFDGFSNPRCPSLVSKDDTTVTVDG